MPLLDELNEKQQEAVINFNGPSLILSGAGSGKTRVLTYRIAFMIEKGVRPWNILSVTFTNKAAKEMVERLERLIGANGRDVWAGTFHSTFAKILRRDAHLLGYDRNFNIYDSDDSKTIIKSIITNDLKGDTKMLNPNIVRSKISGAKNKLVSPSVFASQAGNFFEREVAEVYNVYQKRLRQNNAMDFDDLILVPIQLFEQHPKVLEAYQNKFSYILVDEYQDTNHAQYKLINLLAATHRNLCVIGDDDQSIYSFRGADISNILNFEKDYPETKIFKLEQNYRSTKNILQAASDVVSNNVLRKEKTIWTANGKGEKIALLEAYDEKGEALNVLTHLTKEITINKKKFSDFAVLYRTNSQSRVLEDVLRINGISYRVFGGLKFYDRKEIKDVLAYLKILVNPRDDQTLKRIVNYPSRKIGDTSVTAIEDFANKKQCSMLEVCAFPESVFGLSARSYGAVKRFYDEISEAKEKAEILPLDELVNFVAEKFRLVKVYEEEGSEESLIRKENILELLEGIKEFYEEREDKTLTAFLQEVSLITDVDKANESTEAVTLMTVHSAKGLEFPVVFVAGLEDGLFPILSQDKQEKEIEEERRLFYVAVTRAKEKLFLSFANNRRRFGYDLERASKSRFLEEISAELLDNLSQTKFKSYLTETKIPQKTVSSVSQQTQPVTFSKPSQNFSAGMVVTHEVFGKGKISAVSGSGAEARLIINFESVGVKTLIVKFAKLEIL
ncbi:UvrD-helicase domain-containing protein [bacterium]|nr:UvrD-helicase domain-containing protein [bacterium]